MPEIYEKQLPLQKARDAATQTVQTWLLDPLKAPGFNLPDLSGASRTLLSTQGRPTLLHFWSVDSPACMEQLQQLQRSHAGIASAGNALLAVNVDRTEGAAKARGYATQHGFTFPVLFATEEVAGIYNIIFRYLYDRRRNLPLPGSFLLDRQGMIVKVYQGAVAPDQVIADARSIPSTQQERLAKALPFAGTLQEAQFTRNDFTYGVAMFQHGYLDQRNRFSR